MKKLLIIVLMLGTASVIFASGRTEAGDPESPITIQYGFWGNPDSIGVEQEIIDAFHKSGSGIRIEPVVSGYNDYHTKLLTLFAGGMAPDVMRIDSYFFQDFNRLNALQPIDDLVERDGIDTSVYYRQGITENTYQGKLYGLPWGTAALYMLINLDVLEQAGLELPDLEWSVDDFETMLRAYASIDEVYGFAADLRSMSNLLPFIWANGGDVFSEDRRRFTMNQAPAVEGLQNLADLYQEGLMPQDTVSADADTLTRWFINNRIAMRMGSAAEVLSLQKVDGLRFEAWPMPGGRESATTVFKSNVIGINSSSEETEAAWTFLKFLRGPRGEGETLYMQARRIPPSIDDQKYWALYADADKYPKMIEENSKIIAERYGHNLPVRPGWLEIQQLVIPAYQQIFLGVKSAEEVMDDLAGKAQTLMDRNAE